MLIVLQVHPGVLLALYSVLCTLLDSFTQIVLDNAENKSCENMYPHFTYEETNIRKLLNNLPKI